MLYIIYITVQSIGAIRETGGVPTKQQQKLIQNASYKSIRVTWVVHVEKDSLLRCNEQI